MRLPVFSALFFLYLAPSAFPAEVKFNRDIRPILSDKCFTCHGPDGGAREADLRLDIRAEAIKAGIVPGDPDASPVLQRILEEDPKERMPPRKTHKTVSPEEAAKLRQWIADGAEYQGHWAFIPVTEPEIPEVAQEDWPLNEIDRFILAKLESNGLKPSAKADRATVLRRVSLDLTGLPPSPDEVAAFLEDPSPDQEALSKAVDRLLASPQHGEHAAWRWLDAARYADSDGYESDPLRNMWPWRDWVVESINQNMPYDQFVIEQLAGDLLEDPSMRQLLATGFNRNHRLNNEGGILPEEWIVEYVCDRAETTATVFMALTWQCARCHDHKFDPIPQKDYYQLFAFFNTVPEDGRGRGANAAPPMMDVPALPHFEEYAALQPQITELEKQLAALKKDEGFAPAKKAWLEQLKADEEARQKLPRDLGKTPVEKWNGSLHRTAEDYFLRVAYEPGRPIARELGPLNQRSAALRQTGAKVMIMGEMEDDPRKSYILDRGAYDQPKEEVFPETPSALPPMDPNLPKNRLGLAQWLVEPDHPLTARVMVNRIWEQYFGTGIVKTQEDFGSQGELPSHPDLLDYLAWRFVQEGWDVKALRKLIVTSATYQQVSLVTPELLEIDPENRLLARGPRYRLPAAVIRDQALAASGLMVGTMGGEPVKPYQPEGLWKEIIKGRVVYKRDTGDALYRRSLYTLWRRAVKPPLMMLLDSNERDTCAVNARRTNTPLQALLLMNDITFVETARALATRMIQEGGDDEASRITHGMLLLTAREPSAEEADILVTEFANQLAHYQSHPEEAAELIAYGESKPAAGLDAAELAAYTNVARILLNLDETITKE